MATLERTTAVESDRLAGELFKWTAAGAVALLALFVVVNALATIYDLATPLPYLDQWDIVREIQAWENGGHSWDVWWGQHDEHRPVVPRLFLYADFWFFGGANVSNYVEIAVFQAALVAIVALMAWQMVAHRSDRLFVGTMCISVVVALGFSTVQVENFIHAFQVLAIVGFLAAVASFLLLTMARGRRPAWSAACVVGALLLAAVSQFSFANGMLAWPVLLALAWWMGMRWYWLAAIALVGAALVGLHFADYTPIPGRSPLNALEHPLRLGIFWLRVMGSPFIPVLGTGASTVIGAAGLVAYGLLLRRALRNRRQTPGPELVLFALMTFTVLTAAAVAAGRSQLGLFWAEAPRYAQGPVLFWGALFTLGWLALEGQQTRAAWQFAGVAGALSLTIIPAVTPDEALPPWQSHFGSFEQAEDSIYAGVLDRDVLARLFPYDRTVELPALLDTLAEHHWSVFREGNSANLVGRRLDEVANGTTGVCVGQFDATHPVKNVGVPGSMVVGWAWDLRRDEAPERIVIVDQGGTIVGQAASSEPRIDVRVALGLGEGTPGWVGYSRATAEPASAYAILSDGSACRLPGERPIPSAILNVP